MIEKLERLVDEVGALHSKLILIIGVPRTGKTALLHALAKNRGVTALCLHQFGEKFRLFGKPRERKSLLKFLFSEKLPLVMHNLANLFSLVACHHSRHLVV